MGPVRQNPIQTSYDSLISMHLTTQKLQPYLTNITYLTEHRALKVLCPTTHKTRSSWRLLPSQSLGLVLKKLHNKSNHLPVTQRNTTPTQNCSQVWSNLKTDQSVYCYSSKPHTRHHLYKWTASFNQAKYIQLECWPMPNVMVALSNIGGALCSTPQSLADAHYLTTVQ